VNISGQWNVSRKWGAVKQSIMQSSIYITMFNLLLLSITAYDTAWLQKHLIRPLGLNFIIYESVIVAFLLLFLLLVWKVDMPGFYKSWNNQWWVHDNPMREFLERTEKVNTQRLDAIDANIEALKKKLDKLVNGKGGVI